MTINHKALLVFSFLAKGSISLALIGNDVQRPFKPPTTVAAGLRTESQQRIRMSLYASRPSSLETSTSLQYKTKESGGDNNDSDGSSPAVTISEEQSCEIEEFRKERRKRDYDRLVGGLAESNDLTRENARLDSLSSYLIVSCLTGTASYATIESLRLESTATDVHVFYNLAMVAASLGALSGIYATVVFSLCATYGRTSLGMGKDRLFNEFMDNTGLLRLRGFQAYIASLVLFMAQLTLIMAERAESPYVRYPVFISGALIAVYMYQDWDKIMKAATPIFLPQNDESVNN